MRLLFFRMSVRVRGGQGKQIIYFMMFQDECKSEGEGKASKLFNSLCFRINVRVNGKAGQTIYLLHDVSG